MPSPKPDPSLFPSSRRLFLKLTKEYSIDDSGGVAILTMGLRALDRAEAAEAVIATDGMAVRDRWGQVKVHPLMTTVRDFRAQWIAALRSLNLAVGTPPKVGRPAGESE